MSVPMKKLRTEQAEILIRAGKDKRYIGPTANLKWLPALLAKWDFHPVSRATLMESVAWEELAKSRITKYSKPGLALRGARLKEGFSQTELAAKLGVPQYNLSKMKNGKRPVGKKMAQRLSKILKIDYRVFL